MVRCRAAADAEIAHAQSMHNLGEVGDLVSVAGEGIERLRERPVPRQRAAARVGERLECRLRVVGAVGHRKNRHRACHRLADFDYERQHGVRPASTVQPNHVGTDIL